MYKPSVFAVHGPFCSHLSLANLCQRVHCTVLLNKEPLFLLLNTIIVLYVLYNYVFSTTQCTLSSPPGGPMPKMHSIVILDTVPLFLHCIVVLDTVPVLLLLDSSTLPLHWSSCNYIFSTTPSYNCTMSTSLSPWWTPAKGAKWTRGPGREHSDHCWPPFAGLNISFPSKCAEGWKCQWIHPRH